MKHYLRLFLILVFFGYVLNVAQAEVPEDKDVVQAEIPEDMTQAPNNAEISKDTPQAPNNVKSKLRMELRSIPTDPLQAPKDVAQAEIPEDMTQVHKAVWRFELPDSHGTAFFIGPNQVVTNFHVIDGVNDKNIVEKLFFFDVGQYYSIKDMYLEQGDKRLNLSKVLYASAVHDLVILETEEDVSEYLNVSQEEPSGRLFALGYPNGIKRTLIHSEEHGVFDGGNYYRLAINKINLNGLSGGPVLDGQKEVVGVVYQAEDNMLGVIKVSELEELQGGLIGLDCSKLFLSICIEKVVKDLEERVESGDALVKYQLSLMYLVGIGVDQDDEQAFYWMREAARQGDALAQNTLSLMYLVGIGVDQDDEQAFYWMEESAKQGYAHSQYELADMYFWGIEWKQDYEQAFYWMEESAKQGYALARYRLADMYSEGIGVDPDENKALELRYRLKEQIGYEDYLEIIITVIAHEFNMERKRRIYRLFGN